MAAPCGGPRSKDVLISLTISDLKLGYGRGGWQLVVLNRKLATAG